MEKYSFFIHSLLLSTVDKKKLKVALVDADKLMICLSQIKKLVLLI
jgi:hypothetical protein